MKSAIVTGGAGGLGAGISARLSEAGYRVGVADLKRESAEPIASEIKNAVALEVDVTSEASVDAMLAEFGDVPDVLVNNAGIARFKPLMDQTAEDFQAVVNVNLVACFTVGRAAARGMAKRGSGVIINITSINGIVPASGVGAYPAAKAGLVSLTKNMAVEWGPLGIRVNSIAPGFIDSGMSAPFFKERAIREMRGGKVPVQRLGLAADIANAVAFLVSDEASYVSGHDLVVDGAITPSLLSHLPREVKDI